MIFKNKELNLLRCLAKNQGWTLRIVKATRTYGISILSSDHMAFLSSGYELDISQCANHLLKRIRTYNRAPQGWMPESMKAQFANVPAFKTFEELELNLVLSGSFDMKLDYEVEAKSFKRSKKFFHVQ